MSAAHRFDSAFRRRLQVNLAAHELPGGTGEAGSLARAAVCLVVADAGDGEASVLLTLRSASLRRHASQFALPGGRVDAGEGALEAALRETREEIGLDLAPGAVLGRLDDYPSRSGYLIAPFVAWAPDRPALRADPREVAGIHHVRLAELEGPGRPQFVSIPESERPVIRYPILGTTVHAPTAAMLYQFMEAAVHGRRTRVAHLEQPVWAWR
jgi:8-oxo-dGTP pyrophosphatase MutT (NUDIX family)